MGIWAAEPRTLRAYVQEIQAGIRKPMVNRTSGFEAPGPEVGGEDRANVVDRSMEYFRDFDAVKMAAARRRVEDDGGVMLGGYHAYRKSGDVAIIGIDGPMMKGWSKYGGTSTLHTRAALADAAANEKVKAILIKIDSPGGHVAGTDELARHVADARGVKPVYAHIDDLGASAAYWVASQASRITINPTGQAGSIGVLAVVEDSSEKFRAEGVTVHVLGTGEFKGAGVDGAPVTEAHLAHWREMVEGVNAHFLGALQRGRGGRPGFRLATVRTAQMFLGADAVRVGLVDEIRTFDQALADVAANPGNPRGRERGVMALADAAAAGGE